MEKNKQPLISVIVPIYNVETYLPFCINSILASTYKNLEIILVDDGSTDSSSMICDDFQAKDPRCKVIHQTNSGLSAARNTGLKEVTGEYISFIDGDDYIHPQMLEIQHHFLSNNKELSFSIIKEIKVYDNRQKMFEYIDTCNIATHVFTKDQLIKCLYENNKHIYTPFLANVVHCKLYKSSIIKDTLFRDFKISEDTEYNSRLYLTCTKAIFIDCSMYYYVQRKESLSHQSLNSINHIDKINMYYTCLCNTPSDNIIYRALVLERMYKFMINLRYHNRYNQQALNIISTIIPKIRKKTIREFLNNSQITIFKKIGFPIFIQYPPIYSFFIWTLEQLNKLRKYA